MITKINVPEKMKPEQCSWPKDCKFEPNLDCLQLVDLKGASFYHTYCVQNKCKKDADCTTLDDPELKHRPGKCEKKKCNYYQI